MNKIKKLLITLTLLGNFAIAETTVYLTRHAEKLDSKDSKDNNPALSEIGQARAQNIAKQLSAIGINHIFSTKYNRTMQTAKPLAKLMQLEIAIYNPRNLQEFVDKLRTMSGNILVVGHSNTTPYLTQVLSGKELETIEENEYDNLYQVIIMDDKTILNKFKTAPASPLKMVKWHR